MFSLVLVLGIGILFWTGQSINREYRRNQQIQGQIDALRAEAEKLRQENGDLGDRIVYFETPEFQEKAAKEKLNLQKENENVVIIRPSQSALNASTDPIRTEAHPGNRNIPNYQKWWKYFFAL